MNSSRKTSRCKPWKKNSLCYYYERGYCRYGDKCRYRHEIDTADLLSKCQDLIAKSSLFLAEDLKRKMKKKEDSKGKTCGICFEEVIRKKNGSNSFGILPNCKHCFCFSCIKMWRNSIHFEDEVTKGCPECRTNSIYVYKNSFWVENEDKDKLISERNKKLATINCKYFRGGRGVCRLGSKCLFRHKLNPNRKQKEPPHIFEEEDDRSSSIIQIMMFDDSLTDDDYFPEDSDNDDYDLESFLVFEDDELF